MRCVGLALASALVVASSSAADRDLAVKPADWSITSRAGVLGPLSPSAAVDLDGDGLLDLCLHGTGWRGARLRQGAMDAFARTPLLYTTDTGPIDVTDFDGDGNPDLAIGLPNSSASTPTGLPEGRVAVFFGPRVEPDPARLGDAAVGDWTLIGEDAFLGERLAVGDFNGDGVPDLVAGGIGDSFWIRPDRIVGIAGPLRRGVTVDLAAVAPTFRISPGDYDPVGFGMALGDMDGDGLDDLAVSAQEGIRVFRGNRLVGNVDWTTPDLDVLFPPGLIDADDLHDIPVLLRDVNGDGKADLIIGLASGAGRAYVVDGRSPLPATIDLGTGGANAVVLGPSAGAHLGSSVAVGDYTGDGAVDLVLGAPGSAGPGGTRTDAGAVVVVNDLQSLTGVTDLSVTPPALTIDGALPGAHLGQGFHGRGLVVADFDGDGPQDIAAEAPTARPLDALYPSSGDSVQVVLGTSASAWDVLHSVGTPTPLTVVAAGVSSPWDASAGLLADGQLHFFEVSEPTGGATTLFVTPQLAGSTVRLSWRGGSASAIAVDAARSPVVTNPACAGADGRSVVSVLVTPMDSAGDRLGAGLDVRPSNVASWLPAAPDGGFRDLGNGSYVLEVPAASAGSCVMPVEVEGIVLTTSGGATYSTSAPSVTVAAVPSSPRVGGLVTFTATVSGGTPPYTLSWDLDGDGSMDATDPSPSRVYPRPGVFRVVVDAEDSLGCSRRQVLDVSVSR